MATATAVLSPQPRLELPEPTAAAERYYLTGNLIWAGAVLWSWIVPLLFMLTGVSARLKKLSLRQGRVKAYAIYVIGFYGFLFVMHLPLSFLAGFVREHAYGLSDQTLAKWAADAVKSFGVSALILLGVAWIPYLFIRRSPQRWWLYTSGAIVPYLFFVLLIAPIAIDPLFNHLGPMTDKAREAKIIALAERAGVSGDRVYEVDKSRDTKKMNAYATGFLGTKRIVIWDTLLHELNDREVLGVVGHELGHYVLNHVIQGIFFYSLLTLLGLYVVHRAASLIILRAGARLGIEKLSDLASLPLLYLSIEIFAFIITPAGLAFSRHIEHEADRFGLELTRDSFAAMTAEIKFIQKDLAYPNPGALVKWLRYSHPTPAERFDFYFRYRPWETGKPLKYQKYFVSSPSSSLDKR